MNGQPETLPDERNPYMLLPPSKLTEFHSALDSTLAGVVQYLSPRPNVISIYVVERSRDPRKDRVLLAANWGLQLNGRTIVLLRGEGLTGNLVDSPFLPLTSLMNDPRNKSFDDIGESLYPAYMGVALPATEACGGALVLQRVQPFSPTEAFHVAQRLVGPLQAWFMHDNLWDAVKEYEFRLRSLAPQWCKG